MNSEFKGIMSVGVPEVDYTEPLNKVNICRDNVVSGDTLHNIQMKALDKLADYLSLTFGPMGSNTKILTGNDESTIQSDYSKDGHKVLKHIKFSSPIEMSIKAELVDITHHVEQEIGDGTTSAVILASKIFRGILGVMSQNPDVPPYSIISTFKDVVKTIQDTILNDSVELTLEDISNICMISTNGNEEVTKNIVDIYKEHGLDVQIDVSVSPTKESMLKVYDGLTISEGYSDPAYINNAKDGTCEIHNATVYSFMDPIDTTDMVSLFEKIIMENIIDPLNNSEQMRPTVIISPKMSRDMSALMNKFIEIIHQCEPSQKPPLLVITDISGSDQGIFLDITRLCGCKYIKKYIDPKLKEMDEAQGLAANLDNVVTFGGQCELVVSDVAKTKFVNPADMHEVDENGDLVYSKTYNSLINFLQAELDNARANGEDSRSVGSMRKRLKSLQSNLVEYFVGGISVADRDSLRDLVEDAVKNCSSAAEYGVGEAANFEGLLASLVVGQTCYMHNSTSMETQLAAVILNAYFETAYTLYRTVYTEDEAEDLVNKSIENEMPFNLRTKTFDGKVKTSIMTDVKILEAISKIVTIMVTSNQCLLQAPQLNTYE